MKQVLITNFYFERYTGSELHVLEIAKLFMSKGYAVTIAVYKKAYPLLEKAQGFRVIDVFHDELEVYDYDIIFVQHYPVLDVLMCKYHISYKKLIVSKLSVINELEHLPICTSEADMILCVSEECANEVSKTIGNDSRIKVFKNSVGEEYFITRDKTTENKTLKKIAIISNHVPEELDELSQIMGKDYDLDYIGVQYNPRLVDSALLQEYDLIITIGRTVQQCFALKVPVYVYDYFGGPGYINDSNFALAEQNNFSGRGGFGNKTALELKADITNNYDANVESLDKLQDIAKKEYSYKSNFEQIYQELMPVDNTTKKELNYYTGTNKQRMEMYGKATKAYTVPTSITSQLYIDYGDGFNETDSIRWNVVDNYDIKRVFQIDKRVFGLRLDPCDVPAECYLSKVIVNGKEKEEYRNIQKQCLDFDSQFIIELTEEEKELDGLCLEVVYRFKAKDWTTTIVQYNEVTTNLKNTIELLQAELHMSKDLAGKQKEVIDTMQCELDSNKDALAESRRDIQILQESIEYLRTYYRITPKNLAKRTLQFLRKKINSTKER